MGLPRAPWHSAFHDEHGISKTVSVIYGGIAAANGVDFIAV